LVAVELGHINTEPRPTIIGYYMMIGIVTNLRLQIVSNLIRNPFYRYECRHLCGSGIVLY